jgi:F-type H+-transporting ATPase subunit delta
MSQALTIARPYARAAFALARDEGKLAEWSRVLGIAASLASDSRIASLLRHPQLAAKDAVALLLDASASEKAQRFLGLLAENRRLQQLPEIAALFEQLRADAEKVVKAKVISATKLDASELNTIKAALKKRFAREVEVETSIDESLIGGALIDAGDVVIDGSIKGKLARLSAALGN